MNQAEIAQSIALEAHQGQEYGPGRDYIEAHVAPIADDIRLAGYSEDYQATGWLHDVLEDSKANGHEFTARDLLERGVLPHIVRATQLLTKTTDVSHGLYIAKISHDPYSTVGKFFDSRRNLANCVLFPIEDRVRHERRVQRYLGNIIFLEPFLPKPDAKQPGLRIVK